MSHAQQMSTTQTGPNDPPPEQEPTHDVPVYPEGDPPPPRETATERSVRESPAGTTERSARESPAGATERSAMTERQARESPAGTIKAAAGKEDEGGPRGDPAEPEDVDEDDLDPQ